MNIVQSIDNGVYDALSTLINPTSTVIMTFISHMASAIPLLVFAVASVIVLRNKKDAVCVWINLIAVFLFNNLLKIIFRRPRPELLRIVEETGYSFPSGHSMVAIAFYGFFIYLIYKQVKNKYIKYPLIMILSALIFFIGISRIYLGVHYATDVIGGFVIGAIYLWLFIKYIYKGKIIKK